jgi:hypothetical protein
MVSMRQSHFEQAMDGLIAKVPVLGTFVGPMPTRRWMQNVRTLNVMRQLWTVRQQVVNSMQPFQTVMPIIGARNFARYIRKYNGREGKEFAAKYGYLRDNGTWYEGREFRLTGGTGWFDRVGETVSKIFTKVGLTGAEARNQNYTYFAFAKWAQEKYGMSEEQAVRHAMLRVAQTQFAFTKANNPPILRGPTRSTLLQYKRFLLSSFGLSMNIASERNPRTGELLGGSERAAMFGRWLSTFIVMGGLKGLPAWIVLDFLAWMLLDDEEATGYDIHQELREQLGANWANMVVMGLPAAAGVDISGSIVLFPKPYGRTAYDMIGSFVAGPTLSAFGDIYRSIDNKDAIYQNGFEEAWQGVYSSSPAAQQIGTFVDIMTKSTEKYDQQGRLQFKRTLADQLRGVMGFRSVKETMESLEYNKILAMVDAQDGAFDEIAALMASGRVVEARKRIMQWNAMFPEAPIPTSIQRLMKQPDIARRIKRKIDDRTMDTRQRRLKQINDRLARILVSREGFEQGEVE